MATSSLELEQESESNALSSAKLEEGASNDDGINREIIHIEVNPLNEIETSLEKELSPMEEAKAYAKEILYETRGPLYLDLCSRTPPHLGALVKSFRVTADGGKGEAERSGLVHIGDMILSLNDVDCTILPFQQVIQEAKNSSFPLIMRVLPKVYIPEFFPILRPPIRRSVEPELPTTPTNRWSKFGQILDIRTKRGSFSDASKSTPQSPRVSITSTPPTTSPTTSTATWSTPPPAPTLQRTNSSTNEKFHQKFKTWQDSMNLDKVITISSSNIKKMMTGKKPNDEKEEWAQWLQRASIIHMDKSVHSSSLQLISSGKTMDVEEGEVHCQWFRNLPNSQCLILEGAAQRTYQPSIDDVGFTLGVACYITRHEARSFTQVVTMSEPVAVDPSIADTIQMMVEAGSASFSATLASSEHESFQLRVNKSHIVVIKISEDDFTTVVDTAYHKDLHVYLDPEDALQFSIRFKVNGDAFGIDPNQKCEIKSSTLSILHFHAQSTSTRDMIASTVRSFRALRILPTEETSARDDELRYRGITVDRATFDQPECQSTDSTSDMHDGEREAPSCNPKQASSDEVVELKRQLAAQALVIKATQNERNMLAIAVEVRDRKLGEQHETHAALQEQIESLRVDLRTARVKIEQTKNAESQLQLLKQELKQVSDEKTDLQSKLDALRIEEHQVEQRQYDAEADARQIRAELTTQQAAYLKLLEERNSLKAKTTDLSKELKRILKNGQSIADIETQLKERTQLQIDLALAKADVKRYEDEMNEFKDALNCHVKQRGMGDMEMQRVLSQNMELQRLVAHFSSSLSASQDEVAKWKILHENSPMKIQIKTQMQLAKSTSFKRNEQIVFDEDDEDDDEEEELDEPY